MRTRAHEREPANSRGGLGEHGAARAAPAAAMIDRLGNRGMLAALAAGRRPRAGERGGGLEQAADAAARGQGSVLDGPRPTATADASARALIARTGGGVPLDARVQESLAGRIGAPAGEVRVHAGARAAEVARSVAARAFTVGSDIVFGEGAFRPDTEAGRGLLAHELAHAAQQHHAGAAVLQREPLSVAQLDEEIRLVEERAAATNDKDEARALFERRQFLLDERRQALAREQAPPAPLPDVGRTPLLAAARLATQEPAPLVDPLIESARFGGGFSLGTPREGAVPPIVIPWNTLRSTDRGMVGEDTIIASQFNRPDAVRLTAGFYGFDVWVGGTQTSLVGQLVRFRGRKTPVASGVLIEGGTAVSIKTLDNTGPAYQDRDFFMGALDQYIGDAAWRNLGTEFYGLNEMTPQGLRRVEAANPAARELRIFLRQPPTPPQEAWLKQKQSEALTAYVGPGVNAPVRLRWEVPRAEVAPPPSVIGEMPVPSRPPLSLPGPARRMAAAEGATLGALYLVNEALNYFGGEVQSSAAQQAYLQALPGIEEARRTNPGRGITVFFEWTQPDVHPDSMITPGPRFEGVTWTQSATPAPPPGTLRGAGESAKVSTLWIPPANVNAMDQYDARARLNDLLYWTRRAQKRAEKLSSEGSVGRFLRSRTGLMDPSPAYDALAHLTSAKIALDQGRVADAIASMNQGDERFHEMLEKIRVYTNGEF